MILQTVVKIAQKITDTLTRLLPLKNQIIFESNPDFSDNTYQVYLKMLEQGYNQKYRMVWILSGKSKNYDLPKNVSVIRREYGNFFEKTAARWAAGRSKYIIDCNRYVKKTSPKQIRIHLKHGLPMKEVKGYNYYIGDIDVLSVPSEYWIEECAKEHNVSPSLVKPLGFPRNDVLIPQPHNSKNIIWMPTYVSAGQISSTERLNLINKMPFGLPAIDNIEQIRELNDLFKANNAFLYIRLHPAQDSSVLSLEDMSNVIICNDDFLRKNNSTLYSFLCKTDALVSDYSSIYYDYLRLNKPIALVTKFFKEYKEECGALLFTYEEYVERFPAILINSYEELTDFFKSVFRGDDTDKKNRERIREKYMPDRDTVSSENIINYLKDNFGF